MLGKKKKSVVFGIDGLPHSMIEKFIDQGVMPYMGTLAKAGNLTKMKVTLPEISAVSWPSFMTGSNPGTHGIYGFTELRPGSYDMYFPAFKDLKCPTFWDKLGEKVSTVRKAWLPRSPTPDTKLYPGLATPPSRTGARGFATSTTYRPRMWLPR